MRILLIVFAWLMCFVLNASMFDLDFLEKSDAVQVSNQTQDINLQESLSPYINKGFRLPKPGIIPKGNALKPKGSKPASKKSAPKGSHDINKRESNREKHENADGRRQKEQRKAAEKKERNKKKK